jgi:hypothetical protein
MAKLKMFRGGTGMVSSACGGACAGPAPALPPSLAPPASVRDIAV